MTESGFHTYKSKTLFTFTCTLTNSSSRYRYWPVACFCGLSDVHECLGGPNSPGQIDSLHSQL